MNKSIRTQEFGLDVIYRHDYDFRDKSISEYTEKSCKYFEEFITNVYHSDSYETFLDIGCANTQVLDYFKNKYRCRGIDLYPLVEDERIRQGDFYELTEYYGDVDLIFCNHTLEHSLAPLLLEQISKIHRIGGSIFIAVPDGDYSWAYDITSSTTHWSLFNEGFLRHMLTQYGYECHVEKNVSGKIKENCF
jgi:SAM-dependent methyltransferase